MTKTQIEVIMSVQRRRRWSRGNRSATGGSGTD